MFSKSDNRGVDFGINDSLQMVDVEINDRWGRAKRLAPAPRLRVHT